MERVELEGFLSQGLSLAEIGRQVGLHEATVGYWVQKHGLEAVNRRKHASKGEIQRDELEALVMTVRPSRRSPRHLDAARQRSVTGWQSTAFGLAEV
jgi:IS30 family transposase